ncbi:MAG: hypothetical protein QOH88_1099 [Verrucomicrobiota bacterium]|jgi:undecaprenyl phosphate-alpha-L-ara4N flippase subunit ArnE
MTAISFAIVLIALIGHVAGELVLKKAMDASNSAGFRSRRFVVPFSAGILLMTVQFFLGLGLLQRYDLSFIYPFQGLSVILITIAAAVLLREKLTLQLILGSALISVGVVLVSTS